MLIMMSLDDVLTHTSVNSVYFYRHVFVCDCQYIYMQYLYIWLVFHVNNCYHHTVVMYSLQRCWKLLCADSVLWTSTSAYYLVDIVLSYVAVLNALVMVFSTSSVSSFSHLFENGTYWYQEW